MLQSIWQVLANYGLDVQEIADAIGRLLKQLEPILDQPVVGSILGALGSFSPVITTVAETTNA